VGKVPDSTPVEGTDLLADTTIAHNNTRSERKRSLSDAEGTGTEKSDEKEGPDNQKRKRGNGDHPDRKAILEHFLTWG
jgi:hypothetical protein